MEAPGKNALILINQNLYRKIHKKEIADTKITILVTGNFLLKFKSL